MERIRIRRNGRPDLVFPGRELASTEPAATDQEGRGWSGRLYKTQAGRYVLAGTFGRLAAGAAVHVALVFSSLADLWALSDSGHAISELGARLVRQAMETDRDARAFLLLADGRT